jgi:RNA polymerase sigma-70 factor (ECF subfamily)
MGKPEPTQPTQWIERHADALFGYAVLQLGNREEAEERVQETFLAALEAQATFRGESSERTWLMGILKHKICDHFRRRKRTGSADEPAVSEAMAAMFTADGKWKKNLPAAWPGVPEAVLEKGEFWAVLRDCLSKLPARMGEAFCLRHMHGLEAEKICKVLETTPTNLWTLLHRARALLRACLERSGFGRAHERNR